MRRSRLVLAAVGMALLLWYLRDPAWLDGISSGLRPWQQSQDGVRYRWSGGHASFFVPAVETAVRIPLSTTFTAGDPPMAVRLTVDDRPAGGVVLTDSGWHDLVVPLGPTGSRHVRRIDVRTSVTRDDNHGVRIGEVAAAPAAPGPTR